MKPYAEMTDREVNTFIANRLGPFCQSVPEERPTLEDLRNDLMADLQYPHDDMSISLMEVAAKDCNSMTIIVALQNHAGGIMHVVNHF
jgi:hypothetical protein